MGKSFVDEIAGEEEEWTIAKNIFILNRGGIVF